MRAAFPLQWPEGWSRTPAEERKASRFGLGGRSTNLSFAQTRDFVIAELRRLGAANGVITSNLPVRGDGIPYANASAGGEPGIAVWFVLRDQERVFACDCWKTISENLYAVGLSIEAMRGLERWGAADVVARAFSGFAALPPGDPAHAQAPKAKPKKPWHEVLGVELQLRKLLPGPDLLAIVKQRHRERIKLAHPDLGGDPAIAAEVNAALAEAEQELVKR